MFLPEFKAPELKETPAAPAQSAVADNAGAAVAAPAEQPAVAAEASPAVLPAAVASTPAVEPSTEAYAWEFTGKESLHPFWALEKFTAEDLAKKKGQVDFKTIVFNCELEDARFVDCVVGVVGKSAVNTSVEVFVPLITNTSDVRKGDVLVMQVDKQKTPAKRTQDWQSFQQDSKRAHTKKVKDSLSF